MLEVIKPVSASRRKGQNVLKPSSRELTHLFQSHVGHTVESNKFRAVH